jgi:ligand-binding SRPBCC domain-containing protein
MRADCLVTIEEITCIDAPIERCFDLARSVEVHVLGNVHYGEQAVATAGVTSGLIGASQQVTWRAKHFCVWQQLTSEITRLDPPSYFRDVMVQGIFRSMEHDHHFRQLPSGQTEMRDIFIVAAPLPGLGRLAEILFMREYMRKLLHERNAVIKRVAESSEWRQYLPQCAS